MSTTSNLLLELMPSNPSGPDVIFSDAMAAIDAAITAVGTFPITSSNALAITQAQLAAYFTFNITNGGATANSAITVAASARGDFVVNNTLAYAVTVAISGQAGPIPSIAAGEKARLHSDGVNVSAIEAPGATYVSGALSPTAPNSIAAITMQGMAGAITPKKSGNILVTIEGTFVTSAALVDQGITARAYYGTGSAPASNAAVTGTGIGATIEATNAVAPTAAGDVHIPFSCTGLITGAVLGTALWLDLGCEAITTASTFSISNAVITAVEI